MKSAITLLAMLLLLGSMRPAMAQYFDIAESESFVVRCLGGYACQLEPTPDFVHQGEAFAEFEEQRRIFARQVAEEAESILNWFVELGYPELKIATHNGKYLLAVVSDDICADSSATACFKADDGRFNVPRVVFLPSSALLAGRIDANTLAHELAHGLDRIKPSPKYGVDWLGEAISTAIGNAWTRRSGHGEFDTNYFKSLDLPFNLGTEGGYEKWDYLEEVGLSMGSLEMVEYLGSFFPLANEQPHKGLDRLYDNVEGETFDRVYPEYVAQFNSMDRSYRNDNGDPADNGDYYNSFSTKRVSINHASGAFSISYDLSVKQFATDPVFFERVNVMHSFSGASVAKAEKFAQVITSADQVDDTQLVFEHRVAENRRTRYLFTGINPIDGGFVRVTNAASEVANNKAQNYKLRFQASPVEFELPTCMAVNTSVEIPIIVGNLEGVDNWELRPSAGTINGQTFTAPSNAGDIEISLMITSHITRAETGIAPATPEVTTVNLGTIPVREKLCNIRMRMSGEGETVTITYDTPLDYSEVLAPEGVKLYMSGNRVAVFEPSGGGWIPIPAGAQAMVMSQMRTMMGLASSPPWADPQENFFHRTPLMFSQWYDWKGVTDQAFPNIPKSRVGTSVACPLGGQDCIAASVAGIELIYNEQRQIEQISQGAQVGRFEYGSFDVGRPPGW